MKEIPPELKKETLSAVGKIADFAQSQLSHWKNSKQFKELRNREYVYSLKGFDEHKCIFIHIPKSAGVSINKELFGNLGGAHRSVRTYKRVFGPATFRKYFKFTFVRNPYSRLLSAYRFLKKGGFCDVDRQWAEENLSQYSSFREFVHDWLTEESVLTYNHFRPQFMFLCDRSYEPEVDFVGHFETLTDDFEVVCKRLNVDCELKEYNKGPEKNDHWSSFYTQAELDIVHHIYRKDFELFGYGAEPSKSSRLLEG